MSDYSIYPSALDGYLQLPLAVDGTTEVDAASVNRLRSAIVNIESELGTAPSGDYGTVSSRLSTFETLILDYDYHLTDESNPHATSLANLVGGTITELNDLLSDGTVETEKQNVITVAKTGGNFTSIKDALDSITDASTSNRYILIIYPGRYSELNPVTVPNYVSINAIGRHETVQMYCSNPNAHGMIMGSDSDIVGLDISNVSGSGFAGFYISSSIQNIDLHDIEVSDCEIGIISEATGRNEVRVRECILNGTIGTGILAQTGGKALLSDIAVGNGTTVETFCFATGTGSTIGINSSDSEPSVGINGLFVDDGGTIRANGIHLAGSVTNMIRVGPTNTSTISIVGVDISGTSTFDLLVESSGSTIRSSGCRIRNDRVSLVTGVISQASFFSDTGGDEGHIILGELHVGRYDKGSESTFGEGDSHTFGMKVFTNTNGTVGTWVDVTDTAISNTSSTFTMLPALTTDASIYIGGNTAFNGLKALITGAINIGSGGIIAEYWDGSAWQIFDAMSTLSSPPYTQYGADHFGNAETQQIRFGDMTLWAKSTLNGSEKYWIRIRITGTITTSPIIEQFKMHTNRTEINADGFVEFFGNARPVRDINVHFKLAEDLSGSSPGNQALNLASNITITPKDNKFNNNALDGNGFLVLVPEGIDTSFPITFEVEWIPLSTAVGDIEIDFEFAVLNPDDLLDGAKSGTTSTVLTSVNNNQYKPFISIFTLNINGSFPGDKIAYRYSRDATGSNPADTFSANIAIVRTRMTGKFWR
jgi:hypothetical protein